jgi:pyruvate/2-oxoglutarate dehydrogenase complex dihydrolipoamide dehydrogenase (E3) component
MEKYDLIVVGSGPGGQRAAIQAAKFGKRAALVEKLEVIGGTAINTGTIPSKTIREAVLHLSGYQYQTIYGRSLLPRPQRHQNRNRCHSRATFTQRHRRPHGHGQLYQSSPHASHQFARAI